MKYFGSLGILFVIILLSSFVSSLDANTLNQQAESVEEKLQDINSQVETTKEILSDEEVRNEYLKKKFVSVLETKPFFNSTLNNYRKISPYTDPSFEYFLGIAPEFSLFFILVSVVWLFLVKYYFAIYGVLRDTTSFSRLASFLISIAGFGILIILNFFQTISLFLANKFVTLTEFLTSPVMKIIFFVFFIVALIFLSKFSREIRVLVRYVRMKMNKSDKEGKEKELLARQESATRAAEETASVITGEDK
jgi:hypothetical protein